MFNPTNTIKRTYTSMYYTHIHRGTGSKDQIGINLDSRYSWLRSDPRTLLLMLSRLFEEILYELSSYFFYIFIYIYFFFSFRFFWREREKEFFILADSVVIRLAYRCSATQHPYELFIIGITDLHSPITKEATLCLGKNKKEIK